VSIPTLTLLVSPDDPDAGAPVSIGSVVLYIVVQADGHMSLAGGLPYEYVPEVVDRLKEYLAENPLENHEHTHRWPGDR
jgi:hypothetical protein